MARRTAGGGAAAALTPVDVFTPGTVTGEVRSTSRNLIRLLGQVVSPPQLRDPVVG
ncbi:hypothetical protein GCM10010199_32210 [Dactylosporangium roseum]